MKKFLKVLATTAVLASVIPMRGKADDNGGTVEALLWKATWKRDPDYQSEPELNISIGFNNPFKKMNNETHLFADELVVDYCCDSTLVEDCAVSEECACNEEAAADTCCCEEESADCGCAEHSADCGCEGESAESQSGE